MNIDYSLILSKRFGGKTWSIVESDYDTLNWQDESTKPTQQELDDMWQSVQQEIIDEESAKETAKQLALEKLAKLGLTPEEVKIIVGL